ncbi:hypothetical protein L6452_01441 [Arctium lappa]|uniref:Uncharacterized protein n=1 Tax=Arctium lappa TaxID=4217 RepID=A0ACB9FHQ0_ARCLA|nr:hypothetical protein L6452_01441 [Arctium lappa]
MGIGSRHSNWDRTLIPLYRNLMSSNGYFLKLQAKVKIKKRHLDQLINVITSSCPPTDVALAGHRSKNSNGSHGIQTNTNPEILLNICDLLCFCVLHHPYRINSIWSSLSISQGQFEDTAEVFS